MITNTFLHFKGIGKSKETDFWNESIYNWNDLKKISLVKNPLITKSKSLIYKNRSNP